MELGKFKRNAAIAALDYVPENEIIGIGTGSTTNIFIEELANSGKKIRGAVASSIQTEGKLRQYGIPIFELNDVPSIPIYVDGADEVNSNNHLIKGGGGALTREKIIAAASDKFFCIVDNSKVVDTLGAFPLPVEVIPMARSHVLNVIDTLGGKGVLRENFRTDNGNVIVDVGGMKITAAVDLETSMNQITGAVENGIFARKPADKVLIGTDQGAIEN